MRVDKTLAAGDLEEVKRGPEGAVESAHVRDHHLGMKIALADPVDGVGHVLHVSTRIGDDVVVHVVDVVEVEGRRQLLVRRAGEEVEAAAEAQEVGALRDQRRHRREEEDVIVAAARGRHGAGAARALKLNILEPRIGGPVQSPGLRLHPIRSFDYST